MTVTAPDLPVTRFMLRFQSNATVIESPITGAGEVYRGDSGRWAGVVGWAAAAFDVDEAVANQKKAIGFHGRLGGIDNKVKLTLPARYRASIPENSVAAFGSISRTPQALTLVMDIADGDGQAVFAEPDDFISIGNRLYTILSRSSRRYTLFPNVRPASSSPLNVVKPIVQARLRADFDFGVQGRSTPSEIAYDWTEVLS